MALSSVVDAFMRDLRYAGRTMIHNPGFALVAVLTLALGIGANTAIFTVLYNTVLRPLPYPEADRLMRVQVITLSGQRARTIRFSYPKFLDLVRENRSFESLAAYEQATFTLAGAGELDRVIGEVATAGYFPVLGVVPHLGRAFRDEENRTPGSHPVAIVSDALWRARFGARADVIGSTIALNGVRLEIIGVAPKWFKGESGKADIWVPMMMVPDLTNKGFDLTRRGQHWHSVVGRVRRGVSAAQADEDVRRVIALMPDRDDRGTTYSGSALPLADSKQDPRLRTAVLVLFAAVSFIVLIACVNVANVLLARGIGRQREIAVRLSLGASRATIVRQLLTESLALSIAGAAIGLLFAGWGLNALAVLRPEGDIGPWPTHTRELDLEAFGMSARAWLFSLFTAFVTAVLFGLVPALQTSRPDVQGALKAETESWSFRHRAGRVWRSLVAAQVALVVVLLAAAGLMVRSFDRLLERPLGIDPQGVLAFRISLPATYSAGSATAFYDRLIQRIQALPGVESVARLRSLPVRQRGTVSTLTIDKEPDTRYAGYNTVDPDFFRVFRVRLVAGRLFDTRDTQTTQRVCLLTESAARELFGASSALGHRVGNAEIVGVIGDVYYEPQHQQHAIVGDVYQNLRQTPQTGGYITLRTTTDPYGHVPALRAIVADLEPGAPIYDVKTMDDHLDGVQSSARFTTTLLVLFASLALSLAAVGIYGTLSHAVAGRRREIAIRMALGAHRENVLGLVFRQGVGMCAPGVIVGLPLAFAATRMMRGLLYEVAPTDLTAFTIALAVLGVTASSACLVPAWRAASGNPVTVLRR